MQNTWRSHVQLGLAMGLVGSSVVAGKYMVASLPVFLSCCLRFIIALLILAPLLLVREGGLPPVSRRDWLLIFLQALCGVFLFNTFILYGLKWAGGLDAGIISSSTPAVLAIISFFMLKENPGWNRAAAIICTLSGVLFINLQGINSGISMPLRLWGNLLMFAAVVGEAMFTIFRKWISAGVSPLANATLMSLFGFMLFLPPALYEGLHFDVSAMSLHDWLLVVYFGLAVTVAAYLLWFNGVMNTPASTAAVYTGVMPLSAVLLSCLLLKEVFSPAHLAGLVCVLLGISLTAFEGQWRILINRVLARP